MFKKASDNKRFDIGNWKLEIEFPFCLTIYDPFFWLNHKCFILSALSMDLKKTNRQYPVEIGWKFVVHQMLSHKIPTTNWTIKWSQRNQPSRYQENPSSEKVIQVVPKSKQTPIAEGEKQLKMCLALKSNSKTDSIQDKLSFMFDKGDEKRTEQAKQQTNPPKKKRNGNENTFLANIHDSIFVIWTR